MKLNRQNLADAAFWQDANVALPRYDIQKMADCTAAAPAWLHFGAGNIFRGYVAVLAQRLLEQGLMDTGIIAAEGFDYDIIDQVYAPFDNLTMNVVLNADATMDKEIIASVPEALKADFASPQAAARLRDIFAHPSLQMVSFTITEKGYALRRPDGGLLPVVTEDMENGPAQPRHAMSIAAALLLHRYQNGAHPIAMVSMDNCSHNGEKLCAAIVEIAAAWAERGFAPTGFSDYLTGGQVSFPWSMIDKITPRPAKAVEDVLAQGGVEGMSPVITSKQTYIAPFVNAEKAQYLVIEDSFPGGRPPLEKAGVYFCAREVVNQVERMKVTTCLNPLHTAMSMFGCLLGYEAIWQEMKDPDIVALIRRLGYTEGLPVVTDPGILSPKAFIDEVMEQRLPNPFMPDAPQRIATDTSQKVGIRFGETVKSYVRTGRNLDELVALPLAIAAWLRYLLATDDQGKPMEVSPDPLKDELQGLLQGVVWNDSASHTGQIRRILANPAIFALDVTETTLAARIEAMFTEMLAGPGAVRRTLQKHMA